MPPELQEPGLRIPSDGLLIDVTIKLITALVTFMGCEVGFTMFIPHNPLWPVGASPKGFGSTRKIPGLPNRSSFKTISSPVPPVKSLTITLSVASLLSTSTPSNFPVALAINVIVIPVGWVRTQSQKNIMD